MILAAVLGSGALTWVFIVWDIQREELRQRLAYPANVAAGQKIFRQTCITCHAYDGGGDRGPNLTDDYWIHGGEPEQVLATISNGVENKAMIAWLPILGEEKVVQVASYVLSLAGSKPAVPKKPQGARR